MKTVGAAFAAGVLGMLLGSLVAQGPDRFAGPFTGNGLIHEGPVEELTYTAGTDYEHRAPRGTAARVYPGWVVLPDGMTFIPADEVRTLRFRPDGGRPRGDIDAPNYGDPNASDFGRPRNTGIVPPGYERPQPRTDGRPADFNPPRGDEPPATPPRLGTFRED